MTLLDFFVYSIIFLSLILATAGVGSIYFSFCEFRERKEWKKNNEYIAGYYRKKK